MSCPACGSRGTPLTPHHFLESSMQCSNPHCRTIYRVQPQVEDTVDFAPSESTQLHSSGASAERVEALAY